MNYPRKRVLPCGLVKDVNPDELPRAFVEWMKSRPEQQVASLELFHVSGEWYARSAGPGDALTLLWPWEKYAGVPTDKPFVSTDGQYLFKVSVVDISGAGEAFAVVADSPEDQRRYIIDVMAAQKGVPSGTDQPAA
jgi:hypothetical protein